MKNQYQLGWTPPNKQLGQSNQLPNLPHKPYAHQTPKPNTILTPTKIEDIIKAMELTIRMQDVFKMG